MRISRLLLRENSSLMLFQKVVNCASQYESGITLHTQGRTVDVKSILGLCSLMWRAGDAAEIHTCGDDEEEALQAIKHLLSSCGQEAG